MISDLTGKILSSVRTMPLGMFVQKILYKFSILIIIGSIITTYSILKSLYDIGVVSYSFNQLSYGLHISKIIAIKCVPKIGNINDFWYCISGINTENVLESKKDIQNIADQIKELNDVKLDFKNSNI